MLVLDFVNKDIFSFGSTVLREITLGTCWTPWLKMFYTKLGGRELCQGGNL